MLNIYVVKSFTFFPVKVTMFAPNGKKLEKPLIVKLTAWPTQTHPSASTWKKICLCLKVFKDWWQRNFPSSNIYDLESIMFDMTDYYQFQIVIPPFSKLYFYKKKNQILKQCTTSFFGKTRESTNRPLANPTYILLKATNGT